MMRTSAKAAPLTVCDRADVDREHGDALLAYRVDGQPLTSKTGEAGVQLARRSLSLAGLNLTWQHEFGDRNRTSRHRYCRSVPLWMTSSRETMGWSVAVSLSR